ncbi:ABC transporter permease [Nocardioides halotolerans]|uniref:ABC transporter permease n=1 Tax=Nocardioides halotolerans TaxID=433660 RepID=UPI000418E11E|nr:ABC transporter permease [Nocardioides halotolerans]
MIPLHAWRLPLRLARRDALRHRARSILVLVMIALPVLAVTAADVAIHTQRVSGAESVDRRIGTAEALVSVSDGVTDVKQKPDPDDCCPVTDGDGTTPAPTAEQVSSLLDGATLLEVRRGETELRTAKGQTPVEATEVDLSDALTDGLFDLTSGRWPAAPGEVVVNQSVLDLGYRVGGTLDLTAEGAPADPTIVGVAESTTNRTFPSVAGPPGALALDTTGTWEWLVDGGPVSWHTVRQLNAIGATVASRAVITDPPPRSQWPEEVQVETDDGSTLAILALIGVMALIEVVLLAGPAFAVSARRQQRSLALMAATGGTPRQSRRVIVASAIVLGGVAALVGVGLGIGASRVLQPLLQARSDTWFGPFEVPWLQLAGVAAFGLLSAFLAAIVPAYLASRQDVVAVLAGRRGDRPASLRSPLLGLVLLGAGIAGSAAGASQSSGGELAIAVSAIPAVLGMILLVPLVLAGLARVSGRLPLVLRYAVRDADRHRARTVPAVSAVAATVAGVVALGIGLSSDDAENQATYLPSVAPGVGIVSAYEPDVSWAALASVVQRELPHATVTEQRGLPDGDGYAEVFGPSGETLLQSSGGSLGANIMAADGDLPIGLLGVAARDVPRAEAMLAGGGMVAFVSPGTSVSGDTATVVQHSFDPESGEETGSHRVSVPAAFVTLTDPWAGPAALVSTAAARDLGVRPQVVSLAVTGHVSEQQEDDVNQALAAASSDTGLYVERGFRADDATVIAQLVLIALGAVLMLGGTLTATFLALSDARPDLATLSAVGASPRTRRGVAAAYAVVVGGVGAALGAAVGFIPGIAVTWPLTSTNGLDGGPPTGPFLDVPWLMVLGLVVVLPAVTAVVVGLFARSRLPLVARLD